jgi:hypothetical protein
MIIGIRLFHVLLNSKRIPVEVRLFLPTFNDGGWVCNFEIDWPDGEFASYAGGVDALQSIDMALQRVGVEFYMSPFHQAGLIEWHGEKQGYGFPVPKDARDLLVGYDKTYYG